MFDHYEEGKGKKLTISGVTYDPSCHTISLDNVNLDCVYDNVLRHDKAGALIFCGKGNDNGYGEFARTDYQIVLKGKNYIGGYSTFERKNVFWYELSIHYLDEGRWDQVFSCFQHCTNGGSNIGKIYIEGDGELTLQGLSYGVNPGTFYICTDLPTWYSFHDGMNIKEVGHTASGDLIISRNNINLPNNLPNSRAEFHYASGYLKIGEKKPATPEIPLQYETVSKNLGIIGGHSVSVCYTKNVVFDGRNHIFYMEDKSGHQVLKNWVGKSIGDMWLYVYVDGKEYD